mmetsp:Transcript_106851/g.324511  ORF Transcript_106851/g.324511 Transcript_106851/m.324511 type:complete len:311 (+) Transcript_106851:84-1016(+)
MELRRPVRAGGDRPRDAALPWPRPLVRRPGLRRAGPGRRRRGAVRGLPAGHVRLQPPEHHGGRPDLEEPLASGRRLLVPRLLRAPRLRRRICRSPRGAAGRRPRPELQQHGVGRPLPRRWPGDPGVPGPPRRRGPPRGPRLDLRQAAGGQRGLRGGLRESGRGAGRQPAALARRALPRPHSANAMGVPGLRARATRGLLHGREVDRVSGVPANARAARGPAVHAGDALVPVQHGRPLQLPAQHLLHGVRLPSDVHAGAIAPADAGSYLSGGPGGLLVLRRLPAALPHAEAGLRELGQAAPPSGGPGGARG